MVGWGHGFCSTQNSCTSAWRGHLEGDVWGARIQGCWWHCCGRGRCWELGVLCHPGLPPALPPPNLCSCRYRHQHGARGEGPAEQTPSGNSPSTPGPALQGGSKGLRPCPTAHTRQGAFSLGSGPPLAPPALLKHASCCEAPCYVLLICALIAQTSLGTVPCSKPERNSQLPLASWKEVTAAPRVP